MENFRFLGTLESAIEHPEFHSTMLLHIVPVDTSTEEIYPHLLRMPTELFEVCARRSFPHERLWFMGFCVDAACYCSHFLPEGFHSETPAAERTGLDEANYHAEVNRVRD